MHSVVTTRNQFVSLVINLKVLEFTGGKRRNDCEKFDSWWKVTFTASHYLRQYTPHMASLNPITFKEAPLLNGYNRSMRPTTIRVANKNLENSNIRIS